jgi:hypothetical protein
LLHFLTAFCSDVSEEADLLFRILDSNRTGTIDPDEVKVANLRTTTG